MLVSNSEKSLIIHKSNQMKYFNNCYSVNAKSKANSIFLSFANCLVKHEERHVSMNTNWILSIETSLKEKRSFYVWQFDGFYAYLIKKTFKKHTLKYLHSSLHIFYLLPNLIFVTYEIAKVWRLLIFIQCRYCIA